MTEIEQALISVRQVFVYYPKEYEKKEEALKKCDQEIQDLMHVIELSNFNAYQGFDLAKQLQKVRNERRVIKDEIELLKSVKELLSYGKPTEKNLNKIIGEVRGIQRRQEVRTYKMRVREDLQEMIK